MSRGAVDVTDPLDDRRGDAEPVDDQRVSWFPAVVEQVAMQRSRSTELPPPTHRTASTLEQFFASYDRDFRLPAAHSLIEPSPVNGGG